MAVHGVDANGPKREDEPAYQHKVRDLILNALGSRRDFLKQFTDPRRDLNAECGYPESPDPRRYQEIYARNGIAARAVQVLSKETWQVQPTVYEDEAPDVLTRFEADWEGLGQTLRDTSTGTPSYYRTECGSVVWDYLKRLDMISGIGRYGVLLLGLDDNLPLDQPATPRVGQKLLFLRTFPEFLAPIMQFEENQNSPRFGQPTSYDLTLNDPSTLTGTSTGGFYSNTTKRVHHTRVIHVADNILSSEVFGIPRMQQPLNRLLDVDKLYGGSAEMYWRGAFPGLSFETHPTLGADPELGDLGPTKRMVEDYMNGLQRYLALVGFSAKSLAPQVVDPTPQIMVQIQAICILLGIPMRVFMGSERGELASSQDDAAWNDRLRERAKYYVTPRIIVPFVDRLIWLGCLAAPRQFEVWWPDLTSQTGQEKSQIAFQRTQALVQYVKGEGWRIIAPMDFLVRILGFEEKEATSIIENAKKEGLFDLTQVQTSGKQQDYTHLGAGAAVQTDPRATPPI